MKKLRNKPSTKRIDFMAGNTELNEMLNAETGFLTKTKGKPDKTESSLADLIAKTLAYESETETVLREAVEKYRERKSVLKMIKQRVKNDLLSFGDTKPLCDILGQLVLRFRSIEELDLEKTLAYGNIASLYSEIFSLLKVKAKPVETSEEPEIPSGAKTDEQDKTVEANDAEATDVKTDTQAEVPQVEKQEDGNESNEKTEVEKPQ